MPRPSESIAGTTASPAPSTSSGGQMVNGYGGSSINGKARHNDHLPGVTFGPGARAPAFGAAALQDEAIIAAGPSMSSRQAGAEQPQGPASVAVEESDPEAGLLEHIYQRGFIGGEYGDVNLHFRPDRQPLKLHSLVISRSPTLASLLPHPHSMQPTLDIFLPLNDYEQITDNAFVLSIGYLYSSRSLGHVTLANSPVVLLAASLLELPGLARHALEMCKHSINSLVAPQDVQTWTIYLAKLRESNMSRVFEQELSAALLERLSRSLPDALNAFSSRVSPTQQTEAQAILQHAYSVLPFELFKSVLESADLGASDGSSLSDQTRFNLAKRCIAERKKAAAAMQSADFEETVVLAFGGPSSASSNVSVVRKPRQNRKLWKVNG